MTEIELKDRTRKFAVDIFKFVDSFPKKTSAWIIANQLGRSGSSIAANYRAACRARSHADFISKIGIVVEEADETWFWLSIICETNNGNKETVQHLLNEAYELTAIFNASCKTASKNKSAIQIKNLKSKI